MTLGRCPLSIFRSRGTPSRLSLSPMPLPIRFSHGISHGGRPLLLPTRTTTKAVSEQGPVRGLSNRCDVAHDLKWQVGRERSKPPRTGDGDIDSRGCERIGNQMAPTMSVNFQSCQLTESVVPEGLSAPGETERGKTSKGFTDFLPENGASQGQNLALRDRGI